MPEKVQVDFDPANRSFADECVATMNGLPAPDIDHLCEHIIKFYKWDHQNVELEPFIDFPEHRDVTKCFEHTFLHASPGDVLDSSDLMMSFLSDRGPDVGVLCYIKDGRLLYAGTSDTIDLHNIESLDVDWNFAPRPLTN